MYQSNIRDRKHKSSQNKKSDRELVVPDADQEYALVVSMMGNGRVKVLCADGVERTGRIRGSMRYSRQKVIIEVGDLVIASGRGFDDTMDIIHKFNHEEQNAMVRRKELPELLITAITKPDMMAGDGDQFVTYADEADIDKI